MLTEAALCLHNTLHEQAVQGRLQCDAPLSTRALSSRNVLKTGISQGSAAVTFRENPDGTWTHEVTAIPHMTSWVHAQPVEITVELWVVSGTALVDTPQGRFVLNAGTRTFLTGLPGVSVTAAPSVLSAHPPGKRTSHQKVQQLQQLQLPRVARQRASSSPDMSPVDEAPKLQDRPEVEPAGDVSLFKRSPSSMHGACEFSHLTKHGGILWK